ncbi:peptidoglycan-binding protein [Candidatus Kaiserbacteria bacterium]|nr:peptidoglycan-binding protein [Candidatus Kaiserbacteria bacterium]
MSKALATKNVAAIVVAVALVFGFAFSFATPAKADTLSDLQAQIASLMAQIAALQGGSSTAGASCATFTQNLSVGKSGGEVMAVQKFLNTHGAQIAATGAGSPGNETSYFGAKTSAAVSKFQSANGISPVGIWGPMTRAKANSMCAGTPGTPGIPGTPVTGNGLKVALAADNPTYGALVQGQAIAELAKFTFSNPTGAPITVTNLAFKRIGVSSDSTLANVYLFNGATRLTDSAGVSNTAFNFNAPSGLFTVPAGGMITISVRSDIAGSTNGQQVGVQLTSVSASGLLDSSVVLPITGSALLVSSATLATVDFASGTTPGTNTNLTPANDVVVWQNVATIGTRAVNLTSFQLRNLGSIGLNDVRNLRLYVDGVQVGQAVPNLVAGETSVAWDLTATPKRLESGGRTIKVVGDVVGGSSLTMQFSLRRAADARFIDTELNQPILATAAGSAFSARSSGVQTIGSAAVSVVKANTSPSSNITLGASNQKFASFELRASGEDVKIESLNVNADTSAGAQAGLDNGKVFVDGVQVGSTKDLTDGTDIEFTFGSSFIAKAGAVHIIDIYADAKSSTGTALTSGQTVAITLDDGSSNAFGQVSLTSVSVPGSDVAGNTLTISSATLTATKYSGYGNQTIIAGTSNARLGSFTLSSGSTEGVNVNTIVVNLSADEAASITDLRLVDSATGAQIGTAKPSPSTDNTFSVNFDIPVSSTKTIDLVGNIKSGSNIGTWIATLDETTGGLGIMTSNSVTLDTNGTADTGNDVNLQTITVGTGSLTQSTGTSPDNANVIAGSNDVKVGSFNFTASNSGFTVQELAVLIPANAATSVSSVTLKWPGNTAGVSQALSLSSGTQVYSTATFTGLTFAIPMNETQTIDVYVNIPTVANGATSGTAISAYLSWITGFKAVDSAGTASTTMASYANLNGAATSGKGTMYVRKSKPVLSTDNSAAATLNAGSNQVLGRFTVTADAAGKIDWGSVVITLNKTAAVTVGATTTLAVWSGANQIAGTMATTTVVATDLGTLDACLNQTTCLVHFRPTTVETVDAGTSKTYELRGTVGGIASGANNISASIANPQTTASSTAVFGSAAGTQGVSTAASFAWSDWSDLADHSSSATGASTSDWTGDYLVRTLPLTIGNKSVNF